MKQPHQNFAPLCGGIHQPPQLASDLPGNALTTFANEHFAPSQTHDHIASVRDALSASRQSLRLLESVDMYSATDLKFLRDVR